MEKRFSSLNYIHKQHQQDNDRTRKTISSESE